MVEAALERLEQAFGGDQVEVGHASAQMVFRPHTSDSRWCLLMRIVARTVLGCARRHHVAQWAAWRERVERIARHQDERGHGWLRADHGMP
jgi:hypothetical protein